MHSLVRAASDGTVTSRLCSRCHEVEYAAFAASAHGGALLSKKSPGVPVCTDCHPGHTEEGTTALARRIRLGHPCMGCHGDEALMQKYGISTNVVSTYLSDFHGVSVKFYEQEGADFKREPLVCSDCHGIHDVAAISAESAIVMKENLLSVCQR